MLIFLIMALLLIFPGIKFAPLNKIRDGYISVNQTTCINGLFTLFVFFSHAVTYINPDGAMDKPYLAFKSYMLQMVVVPFLFYSGYGIMESIKKKGVSYVKQIPVNRFLKVLVHFDIAVAIYLLVNLIYGKTFSIRHILLSLTGYESVGNSNWYIFAVLGLYAIVFVSFMLARKNHILGVIFATILSIGFVYAQILLKRGSWCYDTIILFPVGMIFSLMKDTIEKIINKHALIYPAAVIAAVAAYQFFYLRRSQGIEFYSMWAILFMALIVLFTMKVSISNKILEFFGSHVFSIYILQRLPMIVFSKVGFAAANKYLFVVLCFIVTVILAILFDRMTDRLDKILFRSRKKS